MTSQTPTDGRTSRPAELEAAHELVEELHRRLLRQHECEGRVADLESELADLHAEVAALRATRVFRYTRGLRAVYSALRRRGAGAPRPDHALRRGRLTRVFLVERTMGGERPE